MVATFYFVANFVPVLVMIATHLQSARHLTTRPVWISCSPRSVWVDKVERNMIMPSQQGPTQQSGLSLPVPLHHSIHCIRCGATTNFNVNCLLYYTVGSVHEFLFTKYKMKYFMQYFQSGDIMTPSGYSRGFCSEKTGNEKRQKFPGILETGIPVSKPYTQPHKLCGYHLWRLQVEIFDTAKKCWLVFLRSTRKYDRYWNFLLRSWQPR